MTPPQPPSLPPLPGTPLGSGYFIVQLRRPAGGGADEVTGVVERLGTGEKREFRSSAELAQVMVEWAE